MGREQVETNHLGIHLTGDVLDEEQVSRALGHLLPAQVHHAVLAPEVRERLAGGALALGDLVLVMGEDEILAASVDVERVAQVLHGHGGALDVPSGPPRSPGTLPRRLARLGTLPQGEVERVALRLARLDPVALAHVVDAAARELPVVRLAAHVEVDIAARRVGVALLDQAGDQGVHLGDVPVARG